MRRTNDSDRTDLSTRPARRAPSGRELLAAFALALVIPAALWVASYPWTAALLAAGAVAGGAVVAGATTLARWRAGRRTICVPYVGVCLRL